MPSLPQPGAEWAGYRIDEQIGSGARGQVYLAFDPLLRKPVAIKVLLDTPSDDIAGERFCKVPLTADVLGHRNIIRVHAASDVDGVGYVVMDWYVAGSLEDEIAVSTLRLSRAREVLAQVADALDDAHRAEIGHLNVKPSNILCAEDGRRVVLSDFGSTRFADEARSDQPVPDYQRSRLPFYEAPEVLLGERASPAADVYSLGAVLYAALSGRVPFTGGVPRVVTEQHLAAPVPRITEQREDLPEAFDELIGATMAKVPADRPISGRAFIAGLDEAIAAPRPNRRPVRARVAPERATAPPPTESPAPPEPDGERTSPVQAADSEAAAEVPGFTVRVRERDDDSVLGAAAAAAPPAQGPNGAREQGGSGPGPVRERAQVTDDESSRLGAPDLPEESPTYGGMRRAKRAEWELDDGTVDGAALGVYEDEPRNRLLTALVIGLLLVAVALVTFLVWSAVQADSETTGIDPVSVSMAITEQLSGLSS